MKDIYLDHHTTSNVDPVVIDAMLPFFTKNWGILTQAHQMGQKMVKDVKLAYQSLYDLIQASDEDTIIFTSSHAESMAQIFNSIYYTQVKGEGKNHFITLNSEDAETLMNFHDLEPKGCLCTQIKLDSFGVVNPKDIVDAITPRTAFISLSLAHGLTGVLQPIEEIIELCKLRKIALHIDVRYVVGKMDVDVKELNADFITFSSDKIHGPKSASALYIKKGSILKPLILGGFEQNNLRGAPVDIAQLIGFAKAATIAKENIGHLSLETSSLRDYFESTLQKKLGFVDVLFSKSLRLPNVSVISFKTIASDTLLYALNQRGVYATFGGGLFQKLSYLLDNLGYSSKISETSVSFALSKDTTQKDLDCVIEIIVEEVKRLSKLSEHIKELV